MYKHVTIVQTTHSEKQFERAVRDFWRPRFRSPYGMMQMGFGGLGPFGTASIYDPR